MTNPVIALRQALGTRRLRNQTEDGMPETTATNLEPIGDLTFDGVEFYLTNEEDAEQRARLLPWIRVAAVLMRYDDKELGQKVAEDEMHVTMLEGISGVI